MRPNQAGMTLVELVMAIAVSSIVATFSITLLSAPPVTMENSARRSSLRETATLGLQQLGGELRSALPNSIRFRNTAGVLAVEHLNVLDASILFSDDPGVAAAQRLTIGMPDSQLETLGSFVRIAKPFVSSRAFLALHHTGLGGANAYSLTNVMTAAATQIQIDSGSSAGQDQVRLTPAALFTTIGAARRVYLVSGPISYLCDPVARQLRRYAGYLPNASQLARDTDAELMAAGATRSILASNVGNCRMTAVPLISAGQVTHSLTITFTSGTESLRLTTENVSETAG